MFIAKFQDPLNCGGSEEKIFTIYGRNGIFGHHGARDLDCLYTISSSLFQGCSI